MIDDTLDALADGHRRQLLTNLLTDDPQSIAKLTGVSRELHEADEELLRKHLASSREIAGADKELLRAYHVHLPKLARYGFVLWHREGRVVTKGPRFDDLRVFLQQPEDSRDEPLVADRIDVTKR